eukprot:GHVT01087363.1.p1 GENE.GHVT01087363.1~~GHVT01087363.1.p1  ORF type:complete len:429 (-),score=80.37 GHVT01087363.1:710-1996(-)
MRCNGSPDAFGYPLRPHLEYAQYVGGSSVPSVDDWIVAGGHDESLHCPDADVLECFIPCALCATAAAKSRREPPSSRVVGSADSTSSASVPVSGEAELTPGISAALPSSGVLASLSNPTPPSEAARCVTPAGGGGAAPSVCDGTPASFLPPWLAAVVQQQLQRRDRPNAVSAAAAPAPSALSTCCATIRARTKQLSKSPGCAMPGNGMGAASPTPMDILSGPGAICPDAVCPSAVCTCRRTEQKARIGSTPTCLLHGGTAQLQAALKELPQQLVEFVGRVLLDIHADQEDIPWLSPTRAPSSRPPAPSSAAAIGVYTIDVRGPAGTFDGCLPGTVAAQAIWALLNFFSQRCDARGEGDDTLMTSVVEWRPRWCSIALLGVEDSPVSFNSKPHFADCTAEASLYLLLARRPCGTTAACCASLVNAVDGN